MRNRGAVLGWKTLSRFALVGIIGSGAAACSSDASRLSEPFSNPFASMMGEPSATGSLGAGGEEAVAATAPAIRTPRVQTQALGAPAMSSRPVAAPIAGSVSGSVAGLNPDAGKAMTPRIAPAAPQPKLQFSQGPKPADKKATEKKAEAKPDPKADKKKAEAEKKAEVEKKTETKKAETKKTAKVEAKPDPKADKKVKAEAEAKAAKADASKEAAKEAAKKVAEAKAAEAAAKSSANSSAKEAKAAEKPAPVKVASVDPVAPVAAPSAANDSFRWPAKGRVINGYGSSGNEGINIAVPEGTPVKAAEEGTVAYAGSDVKGYGKLVLVRHANGFVSAYAHNGELDVRPGEKVKRGQVIAKSGATGNVTSPQLHFEIRKGATPVDPIPHLASN